MEFVDKCVSLELFVDGKKEKVLVVGDLHLGYEGFLQGRGWSFPRTQQEETIERFGKIFESLGCEFDKIILLGDVKHYFAGVLREEFSDFYSLVSFLKNYLNREGKIFITKGNHDSILEPVVRNYEFVEMRDYFVFGDSLFLHGHSFERGFDLDFVEDVKKVKRIFCGHFHPAVSIRESNGVKQEKFKCFLRGEIKFGKSKKELVVLPSFFPLIEGTDVLNSNSLGKRIEVRTFEVFVVLNNDDLDVLGFGRVEDLVGGR